jgi:nitroimidazol reductase NimA-like FMN-containing flavoprotein (pyridoxamine 5'-phosphate oxidase superfamily)
MLGELTQSEIQSLLSTEVVARIGCHANGRTYVVPITYVYDGGALLGHSGDGMKVEMMRKNPFVCVEVDHMDNLANWRSVIAWGHYEELTGQAAVDAVEKLAVGLAHLSVSETSVPAPRRAAGGHEAPAHGIVVYRIRLTETTGRYETR